MQWKHRQQRTVALHSDSLRLEVYNIMLHLQACDLSVSSPVIPLYHISALTGVIPWTHDYKKTAPGNYNHKSIVRCKMYFDVFENCLGVAHKRDRWTDRQKEWLLAIAWSKLSPVICTWVGVHILLVWRQQKTNAENSTISSPTMTYNTSSLKSYTFKWVV